METQHDRYKEIVCQNDEHVRSRFGSADKCLVKSVSRKFTVNIIVHSNGLINANVVGGNDDNTSES